MRYLLYFVSIPHALLVQLFFWLLVCLDRLMRGRVGDPCVVCGRPIDRPNLDRVCPRPACREEIADRLAW